MYIKLSMSSTRRDIYFDVECAVKFGGEVKKMEAGREEEILNDKGTTTVINMPTFP